MRSMVLICSVLLGACAGDSDKDGSDTAAVGGGDSCERFIDYLEDDCGIELISTTPTPEDTTDYDCSPGSSLECTSVCGLAADCSVFVGADDHSDQAYLDAVDSYRSCTDACP